MAKISDSKERESMWHVIKFFHDFNANDLEEFNSTTQRKIEKFGYQIPTSRDQDTKMSRPSAN